MIDIATAWIWIKANWGVMVSFAGLTIAFRRLEISIRNKRSNDRKAVYERLGALESEQSSQRSETKRVDLKLTDLREGCIVIETKADKAIDVSCRADERSETILRILKK